MRFRVLPSEDARFFHQCNSREDLTRLHKLITRSAVQRTYELEHFRARKLRTLGEAACSPEALSQLWLSEVPESATGENVSLAYVK